MRIKSEAEILNIEVRQQIIEELKSPENQNRKQEAYKRYLCYKDETTQFIIEQLLKQFDQSTVQEMAYCISNISLVRKIIDKLARVYANGVSREIEGEEELTKSLQKLEKKLDFNTEIKKANKFLKLQKNIAFYIKPCPIQDRYGNELYKVKLEPMNPYLYDAVEDFYDRTRPVCYILSDYSYSPTQYTTQDAATAGRTSPLPTVVRSDGKDDKIADSPDDAKQGVIIWWTDSFHFTTDFEGNIVSGEEITNPIAEMPFVNFAIDQDGQFWARGGNDLIDGAILVNSVLTHNQHVAVTQGYGQFWMKGSNLPRNIKIGPSKALLMEYTKEDVEPELGFATAAPQIDALRGLVESYVALLLTTNNLSTSAVSAQLSGGASAPSGIAMIIDKAESMEDVNDQRQIFIDKEPAIWRITNKWLKLYNDSLVEDLKGLELPDDIDEKLVLKFQDAPQIMSETEKLNNLKLRKELGLDTMIDLIMKDNPSLTKEQAEDKLKEILAEKIAKQLEASANPEESKEPEENQEENPKEKTEELPVEAEEVVE